MRPQLDAPRRLVSAVPRRFNSTAAPNPVRRKRLYEKPGEEPSFGHGGERASRVRGAEQPFRQSGLGKSIAGDIPAAPLNVETLTDRRLTFKRSVGKEKMSEADGEAPERAMKRPTKPERPSIDYKADESGPSIERMSFFSIPGEEGFESGAVDIGEVIPGLEPGRVVEVRRSVRASSVWA